MTNVLDKPPVPMYRGLPARLSVTLVLAAAVGAGVGILLWMAHPHGPLLPNVLISSYIGLCIGLLGFSAVYLLQRMLRSLSYTTRSAALGLLFFVVGSLGWLLAYLTLPLVTDGSWRISTIDWRIALTFSGSLGFVFGVVILVHHRLRRRLEESMAQIREREIMARELETARAIQKSLLPPPSVQGDGYRVVCRNLPAQIVAGDFYDIFPRRDGRLVLVVGDVAGKGIGASLIMATAKAMIPLIADAHGDTASFMAELNRKLSMILAPRQFVALCCATYDLSTGEIDLANAGLPDPYLLRRDGEAVPIIVDGSRIPLGLRPATTYRSSLLRLGPGERLLVVTDGLPEAADAQGDPIGYEELERLITRSGSDTEAWLDELFDSIESRTSTFREDDRTALVLERFALVSVGDQISICS